MKYDLEIIECGSAATIDKVLYHGKGLGFEQTVDKLQEICLYTEAEAYALVKYPKSRGTSTVVWTEYFSGYDNGLRVNLTQLEG